MSGLPSVSEPSGESPESYRHLPTPRANIPAVPDAADPDEAEEASATPAPEPVGKVVLRASVERGDEPATGADLQNTALEPEHRAEAGEPPAGPTQDYAGAVQVPSQPLTVRRVPEELSTDRLPGLETELADIARELAAAERDPALTGEQVGEIRARFQAVWATIDRIQANAGPQEERFDAFRKATEPATDSPQTQAEQSALARRVPGNLSEDQIPALEERLNELRRQHAALKELPGATEAELRDLQRQGEGIQATISRIRAANASPALSDEELDALGAFAGEIKPWAESLVTGEEPPTDPSLPPASPETTAGSRAARVRSSLGGLSLRRAVPVEPAAERSTGASAEPAASTHEQPSQPHEDRYGPGQLREIIQTIAEAAREQGVDLARWLSTPGQRKWAEAFLTAGDSTYAEIAADVGVSVTQVQRSAREIVDALAANVPSDAYPEGLFTPTGTSLEVERPAGLPTIANDLRLASGMTEKELADAVGVSRYTMQRILAGRRIPQSPSVVRGIAAALNATPEQAKAMMDYYRQKKAAQNEANRRAHERRRRNDS